MQYSGKKDNKEMDWNQLFVPITSDWALWKMEGIRTLFHSDRQLYSSNLLTWIFRKFQVLRSGSTTHESIFQAVYLMRQRDSTYINACHDGGKIFIRGVSRLSSLANDRQCGVQATETTNRQFGCTLFNKDTKMPGGLGSRFRVGPNLSNSPVMNCRNWRRDGTSYDDKILIKPRMAGESMLYPWSARIADVSA